MLQLFKKAGFNLNIGLHSFRAGGANAAANNSIKDRLFKRHGRWVTDRGTDGYIKDSLESLLSVSQNLGI